MTSDGQTKLESAVYCAEVRLHYKYGRLPLIKDMKMYFQTSRDDIEKMFKVYGLVSAIISSQIKPDMEKRLHKKIEGFDIARLYKKSGEFETSDGILIDIDDFLKARHGI